MFGGPLCFRSLEFTAANEIVVAFGTRIYLYDETGKFIAKLYEMPGDVVAFALSEQSYRAVDNKANIVHFNDAGELTYQGETKSVPTLAVMSDKGIYFTEDNKILYQAYIKKPKQKLLHTAASAISVMTEVDGWLLAAADKAILMINTRKVTEVRQLNHSATVTSLWTDSDNLIVGDAKGVITTYLNQLSEQQKEKNTIRQHWHVHSVKTLHSRDNTLYSGGQEGVVVLWHRTAVKKDFLPRYGAEIEHIQANEDGTKIACQLSDWTIRIVDTVNNSQTVTLRQIVNPRGFRTQQLIDDPNREAFPAGFHFNEQTRTVCTNGSPGKLQFIDPQGKHDQILDVIPRNWVSRLDHNYPRPTELNHVAFSQDSSYILVSSSNPFSNKLHFYENNELISTVDQSDPTKQLLSFMCHQSNRPKFLSLSKNSIKIWRQFQPREKLSYNTRKFWDCQVQFNYRSTQPRFMSVHTNRLTVVYQSQILIINLLSKVIEQELNCQAQSAYFINNSLIISTENTFQIINDMKNILKLKSDRIIKVAFSQDYRKIAIRHILKQTSLITVVDNLKIVKTVKAQIIDLFWAFDNLLGVSKNLQFFLMVQGVELWKQQKHQEQEVTSNKQTEDSSVSADVDFFKHYRKELKKNTTAQTTDKLIRDVLSDSTLLPSFQMALQLLTQQIQL